MALGAFVIGGLGFGASEAFVVRAMQQPINSCCRVLQDTIDAYDAGGTPQMLLITPDSTVRENWQGAFMGDQARQIELKLGVELPVVEADSDELH